MASIEVNKAPIGSILAPLLSYRFLLPKPNLRAGLAYMGARTRLRRLVRDLLTGKKNIKIGAVGGSVLHGQGTTNTSVYPFFNVVARWLVDAFPATNITAHNGAVPATPSSYMVLCLDRRVDPEVDLVFVEYQLNDGFENTVVANSVVMTLERLLRRILDLPGKPAVILMQVPTHGMAEMPPHNRRFYSTMEDLEGALAQYYDVQYLSLRTALYRLAAVEGAEGFRWEDLFYDHHPGDAGNRVMADLVAYLLQETAIELLMDPFGPEDEHLLGLPLPEPMYAGNVPPSSATCVYDEQLRSLVTVNDGWEWVNEGTDRKPKWGFVATAPGARLVVRLDSRRQQGVADGAEMVAVYLHHLRSYEHMGTVDVSCTSGCSCSTVQVDAHIAEHWSQAYQSRLNVSQAQACELTVTVLDRTSSGEHKFKVIGLLLSESAASAMMLDNNADTRGALYTPDDRDDIVGR